MSINRSGVFSLMAIYIWNVAVCKSTCNYRINWSQVLFRFVYATSAERSLQIKYIMILIFLELKSDSFISPKSRTDHFRASGRDRSVVMLTVTVESSFSMAMILPSSDQAAFTF